MSFAWSVEKLVFRVKIGLANDQDSHVSNRSVPHPGRDQYGCVGTNRMSLAIEFNLCVVTAFQDDVNLSVFLVIVRAGLGRDVRQVNGAGKLILVGESSSSRSARAINGW